MDEINGIPNKYGISFTQSAKGAFYVDKVSIEADNEEELIAKTERILTKVVEVIKKINGGE